MLTTLPRLATCSKARPNVALPTSVEDQIEVAADGLDDFGCAETAKELVAANGDGRVDGRRSVWSTDSIGWPNPYGTYSWIRPRSRKPTAA